MAVILFNGATLPVAPAAYAASAPFLLTGDRITLDFTADISSAGPLDWYFEFTSGNPYSADTHWFREVAEEDTGGGVTEMPLVVRTLRGEGSPYNNLPTGTTRVSLSFIRTHLIARLRARMRSGAGSLHAIAVFGAMPAAPG